MFPDRDEEFCIYCRDPCRITFMLHTSEGYVCDECHDLLLDDADVDTSLPN